MILYRDETLQIEAKDQDVYLSLFKPINSKFLNEVLASFPQVQVTNFLAIRDIMTKESANSVLFGCLKSELEFELSSDEMTASIKLNMSESEYVSRKDKVVDDVLRLLRENGVIFGLKADAIENLIPGKKVTVAEGIAPVAGEDAVITYMTLSEKKPEILKDGSVDNYNINLIDPILKGSWMGEKIPPTEGVDGITVKNNVIGSKFGKDIPFKYDSETVEERRMANGKSTLNALIDGAVVIRNQKIGVDNHLNVYGDVDYSTGNIDFDGYVTINGTVADGFTVIATQDIVIKGDMGVGAVTLIESTKGNIFIKGGINGKNQAVIKAARNVYIKYCKEAIITASFSIHIGLYVYDSELTAGKVEMPDPRSKLVGGKVTAKHQVVTGNIGNKSEKSTEVQVLGFDRMDAKIELDNLNQYYVDILDKANKLKRQVEIFKLNYDSLDQKAINTFYVMQNDFEKSIVEIGLLKDKIQELEEMLRIRGEGEVKIMQHAYPKTMLEIKNLKKRIQETTVGSFYAKDNVLHYSD